MSSESPKPARRVVTGHDANERAIVLWDAPVNVIVHANPPNVPQVSLVWSTLETPAVQPVGAGVEDEGLRTLGTAPPESGSRVSVLDLPPHHPGGLHRTESLDYAFVLSGEVDLELDDGKRVSLAAGDIVVQRGTNHSWINRGTTWARVACVLIDAVPLGIGTPVGRGSIEAKNRP